VSLIWYTCGNNQLCELNQLHERSNDKSMKSGTGPG